MAIRGQDVKLRFFKHRRENARDDDPGDGTSSELDLSSSEVLHPRIVVTCDRNADFMGIYGNFKFLFMIFNGIQWNN